MNKPDCGGDAARRAAAPPKNPSKPVYRQQYGVIVLCEDEPHHRRVFQRLQAQGYKCKVVCT